jgi:small subunit ribosomal protein S6
MSKVAKVERPYESLFICPVDAPQKNLDAFVEKVKATLAQVDAQVRSVQVWGRRRLIYPIKHHKDGLYIYVDFNGKKNSVEALQNLFRVNDIVLRYLTTERVELPPPYVRKSAENPDGAAGAAPVASTPPPNHAASEPPSAPKEA